MLQGNKSDQVNNKTLQGLFVNFLICQINKLNQSGLCCHSKTL
jgi:hypothetical protein